MSDKEAVHDRVLGALVGVAVGDALGAPLEFMQAKEIKEQHGNGGVTRMIGGGWLNVLPGEVTDDTQMTLAVAKGIVEAPEAPVMAVGRHFISWYNSRPKDIGATCACSIGRAISLARHKDCPTNSDWKEAAETTHKSMSGRSGGNGALMRTAYVGTYYTEKTLAMRQAIDIARMTHWDMDAANDCAAYSAAIYRMVREPDFDQRAQIIREEISDAPLTQRRYPFDEIASPFFTPTPSGYGVESLRAALHCIYTTRSFASALVKAVNLGGDADTIGAITGGLAGALYGYDSIPGEWKCHLAPSVFEELWEYAHKALDRMEASV